MVCFNGELELLILSTLSTSAKTLCGFWVWRGVARMVVAISSSFMRVECEDRCRNIDAVGKESSDWLFCRSGPLPLLIDHLILKLRAVYMAMLKRCLLGSSTLAAMVRHDGVWFSVVR